MLHVILMCHGRNIIPPELEPMCFWAESIDFWSHKFVLRLNQRIVVPGLWAEAACSSGQEFVAEGLGNES